VRPLLKIIAIAILADISISTAQCIALLSGIH
jgi:hypothetical protein